jgi:hypothetical protein
MKRKRSPAKTARSLFLVAAARGNPEHGLRLLDKLSRQDRKNRIAGTKP